MRYLLVLLVLLALQFFPGVGVGDASAVTSIDQAYANCKASRDSTEALGHYIVWGCSQSAGSTNTNGSWQYRRCNTAGPAETSCTYQSTYTFSYTVGCATGTWDNVSKTCYSAANCLAKSPLGFSKYTGAVADGACSGGCEFVPDQLGISLGNDDGTWTTYFTGWKPSGQACAVGDPAPTPVTTAQDCKPAPDNQTFCIKADGQHCYSLTNGSGRQICWRPGETGEKASDNALQVRNGGTAATTPATAPPPGDSLSQAGGSITKTATVNGTNVTTTTTNYTTVNGTSIGGNDASEPGDGSGSSGGGGDGSASGGGNCETAPIVSGDPVMGMVATQAWATRCAVEAGNAANVTGDVGDCSQPFTVEGTNANAVKLRAMRAQICPEETPGNSTADNYGVPDTSAEDAATRDAVTGALAAVGGDGLDDAGFGWARVCPQMPVIEVMGATLDFNRPELCDWMKLGGQLVLILAALGALRIVAGGIA